MSYKCVASSEYGQSVWVVNEMLELSARQRPARGPPPGAPRPRVAKPAAGPVRERIREMWWSKSGEGLWGQGALLGWVGDVSRSNYAEGAGIVTMSRWEKELCKLWGESDEARKAVQHESTEVDLDTEHGPCSEAWKRGLLDMELEMHHGGACMGEPQGDSFSLQGEDGRRVDRCVVHGQKEGEHFDEKQRYK